MRFELAFLYTDAVSPQIIDNMHRFVNARTILVEAVNAEAPDRHWLHSLTKLRAFQEWGYDHVVYFDADATPQTNLDHLFYLPPAPLYAPNAYWLPQSFFASTLLVIEPNNATYDDMIKCVRAHAALVPDTTWYVIIDFIVGRVERLNRMHQELLAVHA